MGKKLIVAGLLSASALVASAASAQTTTLTFDPLVGTIYGSGILGALPANVTGNGQFVAYTVGGFEVRLNTPNTTDTGFGAHIGDAGASQTFNWHDGGDNSSPASVTLSRVGGGLFNLVSFGYSTNGLVVTAGAFPAINLAAGSGTSSGFSNVSSVNFFGINNTALDDVVVSAAAVSGAVPEPATWGLMLVGFGAVGYAMRRNRKVSVNFA